MQKLLNEIRLAGHVGRSRRRMTMVQPWHMISLMATLDGNTKRHGQVVDPRVSKEFEKLNSLFSSRTMSILG